MNIVVLVVATLVLVAVGALVAWRRLALAGEPRVERRTQRRERTLFETPYERLGVRRESESRDDDATAFLSLGDLGLAPEPAPEPEPEPTALHPPPAPAPPPPSMPSDLVFHFDLAVNAYAAWRGAMAGRRDLAAIAGGPERSFCEALAMLVRQFTAADCDPLVDAVRSPTGPEARVVAALALLEHREAETLTMLAGMLPERAVEAEEVVDALALWRGPTADDSVLRAVTMQFPWRAATWARLLRRRGIDPGGELLARYLDAGEPELVCAGFDLLALHHERQYSWSAVVARIYDANPTIQTAAITAGLHLDVDVAWAQCRELAWRPERRRLCELVAMLGRGGERHRLITWAGRDDAAEHTLWCAALSGRAEAIELALARLDRDPQRARACLLHLTGNPDANLDWWALNSERFWIDHRWLMGHAHTGPAVAHALASLDPAHRFAVALELGVRDPHLSGLRIEGYASELLRDLEELEVANIDFERGFPWSG